MIQAKAKGKVVSEQHKPVWACTFIVQQQEPHELQTFVTACIRSNLANGTMMSGVHRLHRRLHQAKQVE